MKDTTLYEKLLGLSAPWYAQEVRLELDKNRVTVVVACQDKTVWGDPADSSKRAHIHGWTKRTWRHLDTCQFETIIEAEVPRVKYANGKTEEVTVPWAERYSRVTILMEAFVIQLLQACSSIKRVSELIGLDWNTINTVMTRAVERGLAQRALDPIKHLGLDEKSFGRGHNYISVLSDVDGSRILDVAPGRKWEDARSLLKTLTAGQCQHVEAVAMDMWPAYMIAAQNQLPQADIVHDKFHVAKYLNGAVDQVRRSEHKKLLRQGDASLTGTKYKWLRNMGDKRSSEAVAFRTLYREVIQTSRAWSLKESFVPFWNYRCVRAAERYFKAWSHSAMRSKLAPMKKVTLMLRRHLPGLLNYIKHRITNASAEGFNSAIQIIKANARGFRSFKNYRMRILFFCGKLNLSKC